MRSSKTAGLVLALVLGAASAGLAQQPGQGQRDGKTRQEWQGRKQGGAGFGMLLKGIELTAEQKTQLQALRGKQGDKAGGSERGALREQMRAARESGDTAAVRELRTQQAARMQQHRAAMHGQIRAILTPAQQEVFDRNVAEAKARFEKRGEGRMQHRS
jgi:Spy/CpxP family protein refolding chaperone